MKDRFEKRSNLFLRVCQAYKGAAVHKFRTGRLRYQKHILKDS
jgi:hypothetical protein